MSVIRTRKNLRLKDYDYSHNGYYFVTICIEDRIERFGKIENEKMILNKYGEIVKQFWFEMPKHFETIILDKFTVMPNHLHGIIVIENNRIDVGNNDRCSLRGNRNMQLLPKIISQFKSTVTREIRKNFNDYDFAWQKSFYDHIIRSDESLQKVRQYIENNILAWELDIENLGAVKG